MKATMTSKAKECDIRRHEDLPGPQQSFKVSIHADEDFIVRHRTRNGKISFLRGKDGQITAFADPKFEIELIGSNAERVARRVAAERKKSKLSKK